MIVYFEERTEFLNHTQFTNRFRTSITVNGQVLVDYEYVVSPNKKTPLQVKDKDSFLYPGTRLVFVF
jgi:hypothetical protein